MASAAISKSIFEGDNPYATTLVSAADATSLAHVDLLGARARYEVEGRNIEVYWSHWTGWESYALDGCLVAAFRNRALRHRQSIELDSKTGRSVVIESSVIPAFGVRIWCGGRLLFEDHAPVKRAFDCAVAALLSNGHHDFCYRRLLLDLSAVSCPDGFGFGGLDNLSFTVKPKKSIVGAVIRIHDGTGRALFANCKRISALILLAAKEGWACLG